ncbi:MAG TPA: nitroreductase family protein [Candidatus Nanoarchaeia archaeon]|nr:nitroreductase family protein [Candidatus Nanoarchaeia archaeon]
MDIEKVISSRASCRNYKDKKVTLDLIYKMLNAATKAPSAGDLQNWRFVVVRDKNKISEIAKVCLSQKWISKAPCLIVICNDKERVMKMFPKKGEIYSIQSCAVAASHITLMAEELGLGSCWIGAFDENAVKNILNIDEAGVEIILTVGYPEEKEKKPAQCDVTNITYFDEWGKRESNDKLDLKGKLKEILRKIKK